MRRFYITHVIWSLFRSRFDMAASQVHGVTPWMKHET